MDEKQEVVDRLDCRNCFRSLSQCLITNTSHANAEFCTFIDAVYLNLRYLWAGGLLAQLCAVSEPRGLLGWRDCNIRRSTLEPTLETPNQHGDPGGLQGDSPRTSCPSLWNRGGLNKDLDLWPGIKMSHQSCRTLTKKWWYARFLQRSLAAIS